MPSPERKSLMRNLGEFVGHIWRGVRTNPRTSPSREKRVLRREVEEKPLEGPDGRVTLRRTTIEEIEIDRPK